MNAPPEYETHENMAQHTEAKAIQMQVLVDAILDRLREADIPYCLLRNRDLIPRGLLQWSDLDIMVPTNVTRERLSELVWDLSPTQIVPFRDGLTFMFFPFGALFLRVDFSHGEGGWLGAPYTNTSEILAHRWNDRGVMVASLLHQAYLTWCNRLIRGDALPERYEGLIEQAMRDYPHDFRHLLEKTFGRQLADQLVELVTSKRLVESPSLTSQVRSRLWSRAFRQRPVKTLLASSRHILHGLLRRIRPSGLEVAIVGADGAAASSLCSALAHSSSRQIPGSYAEYHAWDQQTMHSIQRDSRRLPRVGMNVAAMDPGSHHSVAWILNNLIDQWINRLLRDRGKLARMVFIFRDSHCLQLQIDPEHFTYTGPSLVARWTATLAPKPHLLIVLDAPPEVIQTRRQEATLGETTRRRDAYRELAESHPNGRIVDATQSFEKVMSDVIDIIREFTASRTRRRFMRKLVHGSPESIPVHHLGATLIGTTGRVCTCVSSQYLSHLQIR